MLALKIRNTVHWRNSWSQQIGRQLAVRDSTHDLLVFEPHQTRGEILAALRDIPADLYELQEVASTGEESCEIWTDAGHCYRHH